MEEPSHEVDTSLPPLLNSTIGIHSVYLDDSFNFTLEQEQFFNNKIASLDSEIKSLTKNQILAQSEPVKLLENREVELFFDRNLREYYLTIYRGRPGESSPQRFYFDSTENGTLLNSKVDNISSIAMLDHMQPFDLFNAFEGLNPRVADQNKISCLPLLLNMRPASEACEATEAYQESSQSVLLPDFERFQNEIRRLQSQLLQSCPQPSVQLLKISQNGQATIQMQMEHNPQQASRWAGSLVVSKQAADVCLQTQPSFATDEGDGNKNNETSERIVERVVQKIVEVPVQTLLIVEHVVPVLSGDALEMDFKQFETNREEHQEEVNQRQEQIVHTDERTRALYDKVIAENNFLREQVITLIEQLEDYKIEIDKNRHIIAELQLKINNSANRDFYKVKLSDLERKINEKRLIYQELERNINLVQQSHTSDPEGVSEIIRNYELRFTQMTQQMETLKSKLYELRQKESSRVEESSSNISRYIEEIEAREKYIEQLSKANQEYRLELQQERQANSDLKNIVQKLWQQTEELSSKLSASQKQLQDTNQQESQLHQEKQDIEQMNSLVSALTEEISVIKRELHIKQQKEIEDERINTEYEHKLRQYEEEIQMQGLTIQQFKSTCEKSEEYILLLNQQVHHLKRQQQKLGHNGFTSVYKSLTNIHGKNNQYAESAYSANKQKYTSSHIHQFKQLLSLNSQMNHRPSSRQSSLENSSFQSNRTEKQQFVQNLQVPKFSSDIIQQLVGIVKESNSDIKALEAQNKHLKNLLLQYQKLLQQSSSSMSVRLSQEEIANILLQNQRLEKELSEAQTSNIDINFFEQIVNELQKSKQMNVDLKRELQRIKKDLLNYESEIFEKTEAINYLNLALIKTSGNKADLKSSQMEGSIIKQLEAENAGYRQELQNVLDINKTLEASIQRLSQIKNQQIHALNVEMSTFETLVIPNLNRKIRQLEIALEVSERNRMLTDNEIKELHKGKNEIHSRSAINVLEKYYVSGDSLEIKPRKMNDPSQRLNPAQRCLDEIKGENLSINTLLYIMYRVSEFVQEKIERGSYKLLSPKSVIVLNYSEQKPQLIQIMTVSEDPAQLEQFAPPEYLKGEGLTEWSCSWNVGVIFDYLINGCLFFNSRQQILGENPYFFKKKNLQSVKQILECLIVKPSQKRQKLSKTVEVLRQELHKGI